jgi:hypothetical protein
MPQSTLHPVAPVAAAVRPLWRMREPGWKNVAILSGALVAMTLLAARLGDDLGSFESIGIVLGVMGAWERGRERQYRRTLPISRPAGALVGGAARLTQLSLILVVLFWVPVSVAALLTGGPGRLATLPVAHLGSPLVVGTIVFLLLYAVTIHTSNLIPWLAVPFFSFVVARALIEAGVLLPVARIIDLGVRSLLFAIGFPVFGSPPPELWGQLAATWLGVGLVATLASAYLLRER